MRVWLLSLAALLLVASGAAAQSISVTDGDTVRLAIRLRGLDTPEVQPHALCDEEHRLGVLAKRRLAALLDSKNVRIRPIITKAGYLAMDKFHRGLAVVTVDGEDVAAILIREGMARPYKGEKRKPWC